MADRTTVNLDELCEELRSACSETTLLSIFDTVGSCRLTLEAYCDRLRGLLSLSSDQLLLGKGYVLKFISEKKRRQMDVASTALYRLVGTALVLAHKFDTDFPFSDRMYSSAVGVKRDELFSLQVEFLKGLESNPPSSMAVAIRRLNGALLLQAPLEMPFRTLLRELGKLGVHASMFLDCQPLWPPGTAAVPLLSLSAAKGARDSLLRDCGFEDGRDYQAVQLPMLLTKYRLKFLGCYGCYRPQPTSAFVDVLETVHFPTSSTYTCPALSAGWEILQMHYFYFWSTYAIASREGGAPTVISLFVDDAGTMTSRRLEDPTLVPLEMVDVDAVLMKDERCGLKAVYRLASTCDDPAIRAVRKSGLYEHVAACSSFVVGVRERRLSVQTYMEKQYELRASPEVRRLLDAFEDVERLEVLHKGDRHVLLELHRSGRASGTHLYVTVQKNYKYCRDLLVDYSLDAHVLARDQVDGFLPLGSVGVDKFFFSCARDVCRLRVLHATVGWPHVETLALKDVPLFDGRSTGALAQFIDDLNAQQPFFQGRDYDRTLGARSDGPVADRWLLGDNLLFLFESGQVILLPLSTYPRLKGLVIFDDVVAGYARTTTLRYQRTLLTLQEANGDLEHLVCTQRASATTLKYVRTTRGEALSLDVLTDDVSVG